MPVSGCKRRGTKKCTDWVRGVRQARMVDLPQMKGKRKNERKTKKIFKKY